MDLDQFLEYWKGLGNSEEVDMIEALEVFMNQEQYLQEIEA